MPSCRNAIYHPEQTGHPTENVGTRPLSTSLLKKLFTVSLLMVALSGILTLLRGTGFIFSLRYSLAIGISILLFSHLFMTWRNKRNLDLITSGIAIIVGTCLGIFIGTLANGMNPLLLLDKHPNLLPTLLFVSLVIGPTVSYFFYSRGVIAESTVALHQAEIERISYEHRLTEANLRVLQAQIEPHFLFNTLSNVLSLIPTKPDKAEQMLSDFTNYLRASLKQTRIERIKLGEELATIRSYLDIMAVRMENRLQYHFEFVPELLDIMVPPLLIQPLVENAVVHGIDPKPEGGSINVTGNITGGMLILEISDTGDGISSSNSMGVGMSNIRDRLKFLYNGGASFQVLSNTPRGTTIRLTIPIDSGKDHDELN